MLEYSSSLEAPVDVKVLIKELQRTVIETGFF
jgi:5-carboxymethyl-2-hydroxymuconate isomerase